MSFETYLIKVAENATALQVQNILEVVLSTGGRVDMVAGKTLIVTLDSRFAELVQKTQGVALAGGINIRGRKIPKIVKKIPAKKREGSESSS